MKIFDAFTFFNELDLLEIRFEILDPYVDHFILVESSETFSGNPKPLYYWENKDRFKKWNKKIIYHEVPHVEVTDGNLFKRHYECYERIEFLLQSNGDPEDIAFCSDLDEIWNPEILSQVDDNIHSLIQLNYSYYLNYLSNEVWTGSLMSKIKNIHWSKDFNKVNRTTKPFPLQNGGWHFSNQGGVEQIIKKLEAYDHSNEVLPTLSKFEGYGVKWRMDNGYDFLGRSLNYQGVPFKFEIDNDKLPQYLKDNKEKWSKMLK